MIQRFPGLRPLVAASLLMAFLPASAGCGTTCPEIRREFENFDASLDSFDVQKVRQRAPDARLDFPIPLLNGLVAHAMDGRAPHRVPVPPLTLPGAAPIRLDGLFWSLSRIELSAMAADQMGAVVTVALADNDAHLADFRIETRLQAVFSNDRRQRVTRAAWRLAPGDIQRIEPVISPDGRRRLSVWMTDNLPTSLRFLADQEVVDALLPLLLDLLTDRVWPEVRGAVLGTEPLIDVGIDLPDWPIAALRIATTPATPREAGRIALLMTSAFDLGETVGEAGHLLPDRATLTLTGSLSTRLMAQAMRDGRLPARYTTRGEASPEGIWHVRPVWHGGSRPLGARLWRFHDGCRAVKVDAELALAIEDGQVAVHVRDARVGEVRGPAFVEAFAWTERLFGDALDLTLRQPASVELNLEPGQFRLRIAAAALVNQGFRLDFEVSPVQPARAD